MTIKKSQTKSWNVLIVDDNEQITKMLDTFMETQKHTCTISNDGKESVKLIEDNTYDIILLDLSMPDFNGFDVIDELEKKKLILKNRIIVFTASNISELELNKLIKRGIKAYILKPVDIDELLSKIQSVIKS